MMNSLNHHLKSVMTNSIADSRINTNFQSESHSEPNKCSMSVRPNLYMNHLNCGELLKPYSCRILEYKHCHQCLHCVFRLRCIGHRLLSCLSSISIDQDKQCAQAEHISRSHKYAKQPWRPHACTRSQV